MWINLRIQNKLHTSFNACQVNNEFLSLLPCQVNNGDATSYAKIRKSDVFVDIVRAQTKFYSFFFILGSGFEPKLCFFFVCSV